MACLLYGHLILRVKKKVHEAKCFKNLQCICFPLQTFIRKVSETSEIFMHVVLSAVFHPPLTYMFIL
jgi:hypothetical protein